MQQFPKPLTKAETKSLIKAGSKVGQKAPQPYTGVEYGAQIHYHDGQKSGYGALLTPSTHSKWAHLNIFSFILEGNICKFTTCEYDYVHIDTVDEYLQGSQRGVVAQPNEAMCDCVEDYLADKGIGITKFISNV